MAFQEDINRFDKMHTIFSATKKTLSSLQDVLCFLVVAGMIYLLFVLIPVWTTPGNDFLFQLSLFTPGVHVLLVALALLNALVIVMQLHIRKEQKEKLNVTKAGSGLGMIGASLVATMGCAACYSSILAIFGLAGTTFVVEHRAWFAIIAVGLAIFAIYHSAKKIEGGCKVCTIDPRQKG